jgi:hypothetical protein
MPNTSNFNIAYPANTALVKDGASAMGTIATGFDSLLGTIGQGGFRNAIMNGDFSVNQRLFSSATVSGSYGFDRWALLKSGGTTTYSSQAFTLGAPAATGYEAANYARLVTSGQSAAGDFSLLQQGMEDVRTFAGAQIVISFWARAGSGTPSVALEWVQAFGTGGSPSATVETYVAKIGITTSWTRYQVAFTVPSISGKTIGTDLNSSNAILRMFTSAGSTFNSRTNSLGIQNATIDLWGVQVERGSYATPLERRPPGVELALCQRYFEKSYPQNVAPGTATTAGLIWQSGSSDAGNQFYYTLRFAVPKRSTNYILTAWSDGGVGGNWTYFRNGAGANVVPGVLYQSNTNCRIQINTGAAWRTTSNYGNRESA